MGRYESLMDDLKYFVKNEDAEGIAVKPKVEVTYKAIGGSTEKTLVKLSDEADTLMLVMGMTGASVSKIG